MKRLSGLAPALFLVFALVAGATPAAYAAVTVGKPAPAFELTDSNGKAVHLSDFKGKYVVLEWVNFDCPFVKKHYGSGNMQGLQKEYTKKDVVWLSICSSAPGKQGYVKGPEANALVKEKKAAPSDFLLDPAGKVGKTYGAKTTPHMFVINPKGVLIYEGAIDDKPSTKQADISEATNYVVATLDAALAGKAIDPSVTQPYGCNVKY